jgi:hypothetical protein
MGSPELIVESPISNFVGLLIEISLSIDTVP